MMEATTVLTLLWLSFAEGKLGEALDNAEAVWLAVNSESAIALAGHDEYQAKLATARLALTFGYYESRGRANPKGPNDAGAACGVMQVHLALSAECAEARASLVAGYRHGIRAMRASIEQCNGTGPFGPGALLRGLGAYGAGVCGAWPKGALARCRAAGVCR